MNSDIVNLRQFYASPLGRKVRNRLRNLIKPHWRKDSNLHIVGAGYTIDFLPLIDPQSPTTQHSIALMPMEQGAIYWPVNGANHSVLADTMRPPFVPSSLHQVLMVHCFEHEAAPDELLRIWWQLLAPGGRLLAVIPHRRGPWRKLGAAPFVDGTAYDASQLRTLMNDAGFTIREIKYALFSPLSSHPFCLRFFTFIEMLGAALFPRLGSVIIIEAEKQIYASIREVSTLTKAFTARANVPLPNCMHNPRKND